MRRSVPSVPCLVLALALAATAAAAQSAPPGGPPGAPPDAEGDALPTCSALGARRAAVMVPPGQTADEVRQRVANGGMFAPGTEVAILPAGQLTSLRNPEPFQKRLRASLERLLHDGYRIDGTLSVLLVVDTVGVVTDALPNSGNRQVDRIVAGTWKQARFAPYVVGDCRAPAYVHVPLAFASDWSLGERRLEMRTGAPQP